jgi:hypothetical protein
VVQVTDALALRGGAENADEVAADRAELVRSALVLEGGVRLRVEVTPPSASAACSTAWPMLDDVHPDDVNPRRRTAPVMPGRASAPAP